MRNMTAHQVCKAIQALMDGKIWETDTMNSIADLLRENGLPVLDITDRDEESEGI